MSLLTLSDWASSHSVYNATVSCERKEIKQS